MSSRKATPAAKCLPDTLLLDAECRGTPLLPWPGTPMPRFHGLAYARICGDHARVAGLPAAPTATPFCHAEVPLPTAAPAAASAHAAPAAWHDTCRFASVNIAFALVHLEGLSC